MVFQHNIFLSSHQFSFFRRCYGDPRLERADVKAYFLRISWDIRHFFSLLVVIMPAIGELLSEQYQFMQQQIETSDSS
jgi:hypothetical protein